MNTPADRSLRSIWLAYLLVLVAWGVASLFPAWRLWGASFLSPLSLSARLSVLLLAVVLAILLESTWIRQAFSDSTPAAGANKNTWIAMAVLVALFVLLRGQTHFLGDSVSRQSELASARLRGGWEFSLTVPLFQMVMTPFGAAGTVWAYQLVSLACGVICVLLAFLPARKLFGSDARAFVFALGLTTAGYMLVFFGYVENNAPFITAVFAFTVSGMAYAQRRAGAWWVALSFGLAVLFSPLGYGLVPALLYLVVTRSNLAPRWRNGPWWIRAALTLSVSALAVVVFWRLYTTHTAMQVAILPLFKNRFTVDKYTLVTWKHFLDLVNLVLILVPALVLALIFMSLTSREKNNTDPVSPFLGWLSASLWLVVLLLDPPLGMPRSWDLLAVAGVPLSAWIYHRLVSWPHPRALGTALLCVVLSGCALVSRAWVQHNPRASTNLAMSYFELDPPRSRTGVITVGEYLLDQNTTAMYAVLEDFRRQHYPEEAMRERLNFLMRDKKQMEAADLCQRIVKLDPRYSAGWMFLGFICNNAGRFDSAKVYLETADALDPYNTSILNELGRAHYFTGDRQSAVDLWHASLAEDSLQYVPHLALATWQKAQGNLTEASNELAKAASLPGAPGETFLELARDHLERGRKSEARAAYEEAVNRGADTAKAALLLKEHPELGPPVVPAKQSL